MQQPKNAVKCNLCGHMAPHFKGDGWHEKTICPNCDSQVRHRLLWATLKFLDTFSIATVVAGKPMLHFAPEVILSNIFKELANPYETADLDASRYNNLTHILDITHMPSVANEAYWCVLACDVLEHVQNHKNALKELHRILQKGGFCLLTVPQRDNLKITYEDPTITDPSAREEAFGQHDHLRIYGDDFPTMMQDVGFQVAAIDESFFPKELVRMFVLFPPVLSSRKNATNYRKIFIGQK